MNPSFLPLFPREILFVCCAAAPWIQRGEGGIINRKIQLNSLVIFPVEHLRLVPVEIPTPLWKLRHQSILLHPVSLGINQLLLGSTLLRLHSLHVYKLSFPEQCRGSFFILLSTYCDGCVSSICKNERRSFYKFKTELTSVLLTSESYNLWHLQGHVLQMIYFF